MSCFALRATPAPPVPGNRRERRVRPRAVQRRPRRLYILAVHTGMRQGELLALRWQDVDLENAVVCASRTLSRGDGKVVFGEPKAKKSRRSIRLSRQAVQALRPHLEHQLRDMEILGDHYQDQGLVFSTDTGRPINPLNLRQRSFASLLKAGRSSSHALSRSPAHLRDAALVAWRIPEVRPKTPRSRHYSANPGHIPARHVEHGDATSKAMEDAPA